ncbi:malto-oligosyltrehalose synthase [Pararobbsia silviterrae]|uniref:Malto-oligosyltrehalose synthase n=1 Tax=Pararobbsia silviterrae TaxID=1792498 RepID=A0A494Y425_9BURK|nr:malto-oligosyltrehalose synthase [Pararobbsia silviterrae]RKP57508.1 malto-oligosyltrehalose synthase [Pararobbsia silviterrae]
MTAIRATVRLQFHRDFTFDDAAARVDYFAALGVSHVYASPITTAQPGSMHGYDTVDYTRVSAELGGEAGLERLVERLRAHGMGLIADFAPNHMGVGGAHNAWWLDILAWGRHSEYARHFDVDWHSPDPALRGKVLAPFLGTAYGDALQAGDIRLTWSAERGQFVVEYGPHRFPVCPTDYAAMLRQADVSVLAPLCDAFDHLTTQPEDRARAIAAQQTFTTFAAVARHAQALDAVAAAYASPEALHRLLERQHFRLASWRTAADDVNWRRFFDISSLIGMRVERPDVFEAMHGRMFALYADGLIDGLRIDHVDGLAEPREYCQRLRQRLDGLRAERPLALRATPATLVVEKILAYDEPMRRDWQIDGTTGYDFMDQVGMVMHDAAGASALDAWWTSLPGASRFTLDEQALRAKRQILAENLAAEVDRCARALHRIARDDLTTRDATFASIKRVLVEYVLHFPVYRMYPESGMRSAEDNVFFERAREGARAALRTADHALLDRLDGWLGGAPMPGTDGSGAAPPYPTPAGSHRRSALILFSQLTAPTAAKAIEDTLCYRYARLISRNEVGAQPAMLAMSSAQFHALTTSRALDFPRAWLTTATHDHKRGEDARARLAVLSEIPERWAQTVTQWSTLNARHKADGANGASVAIGPEAAVESMLYQTLVGAWPLDLTPSDAQGVAALTDRTAGWLEKALREAKVRTDWFAPNVDYERACQDFLRAILSSDPRNAFVAELARFVDTIAPAGAINSLAQTLLRVCCPGVPDLYQGTELWDFSLVDPDNRRAVDYARRMAALSDAPPSAHLATWRTGSIKLALIRRALALRALRPALFIGGDYLPLDIHGALASHAIAFGRIDRNTGDAAIVVATHLPASIASHDGLPLVTPATWADTYVDVPEPLRRAVYDIASDRERAAQPRRALREMLDACPVALLTTPVARRS